MLYSNNGNCSRCLAKQRTGKPQTRQDPVAALRQRYPSVTKDPQQRVSEVVK
jgi:hypothetical protein